jgi:hypothetical protein
MTNTVDTYWVRLYITGPVQVIEQTCRQECMEEGLCVTVTPTKFIYTGGEETGAVIGLVNYPRFPKTPGAIVDRGRKLALRLLDATFQQSVMIMTPETTEWITTREQ